MLYIATRFGCMNGFAAKQDLKIASDRSRFGAQDGFFNSKSHKITANLTLPSWYRSRILEEADYQATRSLLPSFAFCRVDPSQW